MRNFSANAISVMNSLDGDGDVFLWTMTITHPQMTTINVVNNTDDITSNGVLYSAYSFDIVIGEDSDQKMPDLKLTIDNVDRMLIDEIRSLSGAMSVSLSLILASNPDVIEMNLPDMELRKVTYNSTTISSTLIIAEMLSVRFPRDTVSIINYSGLA